MSTYLINIVANSNFAATINKDTEAVMANTVALEVNSAALKENGVKIGALEVAGLKLRKQQRETVTGFDAVIKRVREVNKWLGKLSGSSDTVGYNFMGLSLRIGQWIIPALILLGSAILPVIMGLLAIGSAAAVAGLGLASIVGLGAVLMAHRMNQAGPLNQPEGFASSGTTTIFTQLMKPIWATLDEPGLRGVTTNAVLFVQTLFGDTIPRALRSFLSNIDPGTMMVIEQLFMRWLPDMAGSLTRWGSKLFNIIGTGSLSRLNAFFKYIADGIMGTAEWLNSNGWQQMDNVSAIVKDVISTLLTLGKEALPTLLTVLNQVWPTPLRDILQGMTVFLQEVNKNPAALKGLADLVQFVAVLVAVRYAIGLLMPIFDIFGAVLELLGSTIGLLAVAVLAIIDGIALFGLSLINFVVGAGTAFIDWIKTMGSAIWAVLRKGEAVNYMKTPDEYEAIIKGNGTVRGDALDWLVSKQDALYNVSVGLGNASIQTMKVIFAPDGAFIDEHATAEANKTLGNNVSWEVANSQFSRGASM